MSIPHTPTFAESLSSVVGQRCWTALQNDISTCSPRPKEALLDFPRHIAGPEHLSVFVKPDGRRKRRAYAALISPCADTVRVEILSPGTRRT